MSLKMTRGENLSVFEVFLKNFFLNPGGSSLTKALTQDCLSLLANMLLGVFMIYSLLVKEELNVSET